MLSRFELRRFRGLLPKLALLFAALVPVFYGAIYLAANWDPFGRLDRLPVAVVNDDRPVDFQGKQVHAGQDFSDALVEHHNLDWHVVGAAEAERGLREGDYYLTVRVPVDFSQSLVSGAGDSPQRAEISLQRNDANGFVIGSVVGRAQDEITNAVNQTAEEAYFQAVFANLAKIRDGMVQARDGSTRLRDGLEQAKSGSAQLKTGTNDGATAGHKLSDGAAQLDTGMKDLSTGAGKLTTGMDQLSTGSLTLANGAGQVAGGTQTLHDTVVPALQRIDAALPAAKADANAIDSDVQGISDRTSARADSVSADLAQGLADLNTLERVDPQLSSDPAYADLKRRLNDGRTHADQASARADEIAKKSSSLNQRLQDPKLANDLTTAEHKLTQLNDGAHQVATGATDLHHGIDEADHGAYQLKDGITQASGGASQLSTGSSALATGLDKLRDGAAQLDDGNAKLLDGAKQLNTGLTEAVNKLPVLDKTQTDNAVQVLSSPADVRTDVLNAAKVYGRGLAPLFFSIAMWVFGISGFLVMRPISGRLLAGRLHPFRLMIPAWVPFGGVAVAGALTMLAGVRVGLNLDPAHGLAIVGLTVFVAVVFSLIAHALRTSLDLPGSAILLVWLILQLASTGGTYPREVLPPFFSAINPVMPLTYSIDAYRVVISGGLWSHFTRDVVVLAVFALLAVLADVTAIALRQRFRLTDLHPPLRH